jgi:hypothetical protein
MTAHIFFLLGRKEFAFESPAPLLTAIEMHTKPSSFPGVLGCREALGTRMIQNLQHIYLL